MRLDEEEIREEREKLIKQKKGIIEKMVGDRTYLWMQCQFERKLEINKK